MNIIDKVSSTHTYVCTFSSC